MSLMLRGSRSEQAVRSTGDPPNGIVAVYVTEVGHGFLVSPTVEPAPPGERGPYKEPGLESKRLGETTEIDVADAIAACADIEALAALAGIIAETTALAFAEAIKGKIEVGEHALELLRELRDGIRAWGKP